MKKTFLLSIVTAFLLLTCASAEFDGYIVRLKSDVPMLFSEAESNMKYIAPNLYKVSDEATVEALRAGGFVERVTKNEILELFDTTEETEINIESSWADIVMQAEYAAGLGLTGEGVRVAIIDSGVDLTNPNLQNANIAAGYDYVTDSAETMCDESGHGTNITQMIVGDGLYKSVRGIAPKATIVPLRCFYLNEQNKGVAQTADLLAAMNAAVDIYDCDVVNISWGFSADFADLQDAVKHIEDAGAILVAAVGNASTSQPQGTLIYPAAYENTVGVGSVDHTYTIASSSQQTTAVDACAPGVSIRFMKKIEDGKIYYGLSSGTSFATPAVSGAAALLKQLQPKLTTAAMLDLLAERAVDLGDTGYDTVYGHGFVRMDKFLEKSWMFAADGAAGWLRNDGSTLVKAMYETSGRMAGASFTQTQQSIEAFAKSFSEGETASFFLTDAGSVPLTKAIKE